MTSQAPTETEPASTAVDQAEVEDTAVEHGDKAGERSAAPERNGHSEAATSSHAPGASKAEHHESVHRRPVVEATAMLRALVLRLVRPIGYATFAVGALIALGIVFKVLDANTQKWLVSDVENAANWLTSPFQNTFMLHSAKLAIALNWGIAIVVYAILGRVLARLTQGAAARLARVR